MKKSLIAISSFLTMLIIACSTSNVQKTSVNKEIPSPQPMRALSADELQHGQNIFSSNCARCHDLPEPKKYSQKKWTNDILPEMFTKASLDTSQQRLVQGYIFSQL